MKRALVALIVPCVSCLVTGPRVRVPTASPGGPRARLAAVLWPTASGFIYCQRRVDDQANTVGVAGPCFRIDAGERESHRIVSWASLGRFDATPPNAGPWERCRIEIEDAQHGATVRPARVWLRTPTERTLLDEWTPEHERSGDLYTTELSFAPEGQWMAVVHVALGVGDGERTVEVPSVAVRPVPACR
jgi:hypothetical protein